MPEEEGAMPGLADRLSGSISPNASNALNVANKYFLTPLAILGTAKQISGVTRNYREQGLKQGFLDTLLGGSNPFTGSQMLTSQEGGLSGEEIGMAPGELDQQILQARERMNQSRFQSNGILDGISNFGKGLVNNVAYTFTGNTPFQETNQAGVAQWQRDPLPEENSAQEKQYPTSLPQYATPMAQGATQIPQQQNNVGYNQPSEQGVLRTNVYTMLKPLFSGSQASTKKFTF